MCSAESVLITDLAPLTLENLAHNLAINGLGGETHGDGEQQGAVTTPQRAAVARLDWADPTSWPEPQV